MTSIKDWLQIFLITYNRATCLDRTLAQVLADDSPVRDFDITILDNASTDDTVNVIRKWQSLRPNLKHIRHNRNISGNGNIVRAMELATKEYLWTICDDDDYDWTGWHELEERINAGAELICVADYLLNERTRQLPEYQLWQMTFVPAIVVKTSLLTDTAMKNAYDSIYSMFPHATIPVMFLNQGKTIHTLAHGIVKNGMAVGTDVSYVRGCTKTDVFQRNRTMNWTVGYANVAANLKDRKLAHRCFRVAIDGDSPNRMGCWEFYAQTFERFRGHENRMQLVDLIMQTGWVMRTLLRIISCVQETPVYWLMLKYRDWHARRLAAARS